MAGTTKSELASKTTQHRLVLNTLTTPNIFVYGNKNKYLELKKNAELSINKLPQLIHLRKLTKIEKIKVLTIGLTGDIGRNHLGYKISRPKVKKYLYKIIK